MRAFWKGPFIDSMFLRKKRFYLKSRKKNPYSKSLTLTLRSRRSTILPFFENFGCKVYNGNKYIWLSTKLHHIGWKFGDFVITKKKCRGKTNAKKTISKK